MPQGLYWRHKEWNRTVEGSVSRTGEGYYTERPDPYIDRSGWRFDWGIYVHRGTRHQQTEVWGEVAIVHHRETASHRFAKWTTAIIPQPLRGTAEHQVPGSSTPTAPIQARLLKLEVQKFGGNIGEWQEFWDSFESATDKNLTLANINKFS